MKQRITLEDIMELTAAQRHSLQGLWMPKPFDLVLANICTDVENEEYAQVVFVLGNIAIFGTHLYLWDLRATPPGMNDSDAAADSENEDSLDMNNSNDDASLETASASENDESDASLSGQKSDLSYYSKEDCFPLLSIGQMMEILRNNHYGELYFYTAIGIPDEEECGVGRDGLARDYDAPELCDALWECVKAVL